MKTMEFCSGFMLHGFQGNPWNFPHGFSMVFPWISNAFSTKVAITVFGSLDILSKVEHISERYLTLLFVGGCQKMFCLKGRDLPTCLLEVVSWLISTLR